MSYGRPPPPHPPHGAGDLPGNGRQAARLSRRNDRPVGRRHGQPPTRASKGGPVGPGTAVANPVPLGAG
ncbi:hypothetical protein ACIBEJ_03775 [Nonomuraea sp. NPDC050790]|uniref:hypothetical protein n=1 Tax=Nonomuraea sp. NPDC050790 TaxID=3364371 RepID=UPI00378D6454